jgi:hypothetical protein
MSTDSQLETKLIELLTAAQDTGAEVTVSALQPEPEATELSNALWQLVDRGHTEVLQHRSFLTQMTLAPRADFCQLFDALLQQQPVWLSCEPSAEDGCAYPGWSFELEQLLRHALSTGQTDALV